MNVTSRAVGGLLVRGPLGPDHEAILTPDALDFVGSLVRDFAGRRDELLAAPPRSPAPFRCGRAPALPARDARRARVELDGGAPARRPPGPARRDHRPRRAEDGHQRAQLRRARLHGRLRGLELSHLGQRGPRPPAPRWTRSGARSRTRRPTPARSTASARSPPSSSSGRAGSTCRRSTSSTTGGRSPPPSSTSPSTSSTTRGRCGSAAPGPTSTCPSCSPTSRRGCGTTSSWPRRRGSPSRAGRSRPPCSSRRSPPPSRWTRSSGSCASTPPASTAAAGTTSSASSRRCAPTRRG